MECLAAQLRQLGYAVTAAAPPPADSSCADPDSGDDAGSPTGSEYGSAAYGGTSPPAAPPGVFAGGGDPLGAFGLPLTSNSPVRGFGLSTEFG